MTHPFLQNATALTVEQLLAAASPACREWIDRSNEILGFGVRVDEDTLHVDGDHAMIQADLVIVGWLGWREDRRIVIASASLGEADGSFPVVWIDDMGETVNDTSDVSIDRDQAAIDLRVAAATMPYVPPTTPFGPVRDGDAVIGIDKLTLDRFADPTSPDGEHIVLTDIGSYHSDTRAIEGVYVPEMLHFKMRCFESDRGNDRLDRIDAVLVAEPRPRRIGWATVTHRLIGFANSDGQVSYLN